MIEELQANSPAREPYRHAHPLLAVTLGAFFGLLQFSYFFLLEAYVSSQAFSFFITLFFWLVGVLLGLRLRGARLLPGLLGAGLGAYYLARAIVQTFPYNRWCLALTATSIMVSGLAPGYYFPWAQGRFLKVKQLFFHENNGFMLGIVTSSLGAVLAGGWLLRWGPLAGVLPVAVVTVLGRWITTVSADRENSAAPSRAFPIFTAGLHFGILQVALFLTIQVYFTATYLSYFAVLLAWMAGVVLNLKRARPETLSGSLGLSLACYYVLLTVLSVFAPRDALMPVIAVLVILVALPAGALFRQWAPRVAGGPLFFHENNGFVLGYGLSIFAFVQWGTHFLHWAPLLSCAVSLLADRRRSRWSFTLLPTGAAFSFLMGSTGASATLTVATLLGGASLFAPVRPPRADTFHDHPTAWRELTERESHVILVLSGFCLILLQNFIVREFSIVLAACELSILIVAAAYLSGFSVGYACARILPLGLMQAASVPAFCTHLLILTAAKPLAGYLIKAGFGLEVLVGLLFTCAFVTSTFYSVFLPRLIDTRAAPSLVSAYVWDLAGAACGAAAVLALTLWAAHALWPLYLGGMAALIVVLLKGNPWRVSFAILALFTICLLAHHQSTVGNLATEDYYRSRDYQHPKVRFSGHSLYHAVDVIDTHWDAARTVPRTRSSFLNGVRYFNYHYGANRQLSTETGLSEFTYFLAELPAKHLSRKLRRPLRILILGGGSMYSLHRVRDYRSKTTIIEIDPLVIEAAKSQWAEINRWKELDPDRTEVIIDDAKHYLMTTGERFDLIVMDISAPYYLGTNLLHSKEFFHLVKSRLQPSGIFAESTQRRPRAGQPNSLAFKILRAVADVFPHWVLVDAHSAPRGRHGYVLAANHPQFDTADLAAVMAEDDYAEGTSLYTEQASRIRLPLEGTEPFSLTNMETLLSSNRGRIERRLDLERRDDERFLRENRNELEKMDFALTAAARKKLSDPALGAWLAFAAFSALAARLTRR